jgi:hypothetical protein
MNTFFNIAQEVSFKIILRLRDAGFGSAEHRAQREIMIKRAQRCNLQRRITLRGYVEQYQQKYMPHYYGAKRLSRSHVFTIHTIA